MTIQKPTLGISSCLLGEKVRYNGGHKSNDWIVGVLAQSVNFTALCPEVGIGLSVPRPTLRLIATDLGTRAVDSLTQTVDVTERLQAFYHQQADQLVDLDGYILMQGSPSCGMERVKLYGSGPMPEKNAAGIFAAQLQQHQPNLPVEEAGRLSDAHLAECFLTRVFVYHQWRTERPDRAAKSLIAFHSRHKYLVMLHDHEAYRSLGKLLADLSDPSQLADRAATYLSILMRALTQTSAAGQRTNTLLHLLGYLKTHLNAAQKQSILALIEQYRSAEIPYVVPLSLLRHYAQLYRTQAPYLWQQSVWAPFPGHLTQYKNTL